MKNRFIIAVLSTTLLLSGCASTNNKEKKDEKVVHKKKGRKNRNKKPSIFLKKLNQNLSLIQVYPAYIQMRNFLRMRMIILMISGILTIALWRVHILKAQVKLEIN